ncbi:MAG TPA: class I SAM-dependent methyltransferase [Geminicoccaceae bacterium]|nr:class I SAM-dependent methyltransferase [Geminicoccaceae bacterium]
MCTCALALDQTRADAFTERLMGFLNGGALALMTSIGHRAGLFDAMAAMPLATSGEIAAGAGLNERYVREWLGAMVTGGIIEYHPEAGTYRLPPEHAASLTRAAAPNNVAAFMQYVGLLGSVADRIAACFRAGGGVPYSAFTRFHEVMAEESGQTVVPALLDSILPLVPGAIGDLERGIDVLDIGCGSGRALNIMARAFPSSRFTGYDLSGEAIARATAEAARSGATNVRFEARDVTRLGEVARYDLITAFDAVHDQADPAGVLAGIRAALRPGGAFLMQDIAASSRVENNVGHPMGPFLYTISCMHCMTVSLAQGGAGLGAMWGEETARAMLAGAGFANVEVHRLPHDFQNYYVVARTG